MILLIAENLLRCNDHFRGLSEQWRTAGTNRRAAVVRAAKRFCRIAYRMVAGRQVYRRPSCRERHYILAKLSVFYIEHRGGSDLGTSFFVGAIVGFRGHHYQLCRGEVLAEFERKIPVTAAFWVRTNDEDSSYLYVASDEFNDKKLDVGYGEVLRVAAEMRDPNFDSFRVKLIRSGDPLAKAAFDVLRRYPGRMATRILGTYFGGVGVDEVYN